MSIAGKSHNHQVEVFALYLHVLKCRVLRPGTSNAYKVQTETKLSTMEKTGWTIPDSFLFPGLVWSGKGFDFGCNH